MAVPTRPAMATPGRRAARSEEHTSELQSQSNLVCRLLLEKKKKHTNHAELVRVVHLLPLLLIGLRESIAATRAARFLHVDPALLDTLVGSVERRRVRHFDV